MSGRADERAERYDLVPALFAHQVAGYAPEGWMSGQDWLDDLPALLGSLLEEWELEPIGRPLHGVCSVVIPVRLLGAGRETVGVSGEGALKVTWPHHEAAAEPLALQTWNGHGSVRLVRVARGEGGGRGFRGLGRWRWCRRRR